MQALLCTRFCQAAIGNLLSIEGRAFRRETQGRGLASLALREIIQDENITAAASVTRNPVILHVMRKSFATVSPDVHAADPLHHFKNSQVVRELTELYGAHVGAPHETLPFALGRYGNGLYGCDDPGLALTQLPEITAHPGNGVIMLATDRRAL